MQLETLQTLFSRDPDVNELVFEGGCHDCSKPTSVLVKLGNDGFIISDGAVYETGRDRYKVKCEGCFGKDKTLRDYQECGVYSRIVGYLRPTNQWHDGKKAEFNDRVNFKVGR